MADSVKFVDEGKGIIEGLAMPFIGHLNGLDFDKERFTKDTDFCFDWYDKRPVIYEHGLDAETKRTRLGYQTEYEVKSDLGIWAQAQLDRANRYYDVVAPMIAENKLGFSSGAYPYLVEKAKPDIKVWPWVELSLTPTPSNAYAGGVHFVKSATFLSEMEEIGEKTPAVVVSALKTLDDWAEANGLGSGRFAERLSLALEEVKALVDHAEARIALRTEEGRKAGRRLSAQTRSEMAGLKALIGVLSEDITILLEDKDPQQVKSADPVVAEWLATEARALGVQI